MIPQVDLRSIARSIAADSARIPAPVSGLVDAVCEVCGLNFTWDPRVNPNGRRTCGRADCQKALRNRRRRQSQPVGATHASPTSTASPTPKPAPVPAQKTRAGTGACPYKTKTNQPGRPGRRKKPPQTAVCVVCGQTFEHQGQGKPRKTCGGDCANVWRASRARKKPRKVKTHAKTCPICGDQFTTANVSTKYCGKICRDEAHAQAKTEYARREREERLAKAGPMVCEWCGLEYVPEHQAQKRFCSLACADEARVEARDRIQAAKAADVRWHGMAMSGQDILDGCLIEGLPLDDPQCTPLEGLRELAWGTTNPWGQAQGPAPTEKTNP